MLGRGRVAEVVGIGDRCGIRRGYTTDQTSYVSRSSDRTSVYRIDDFDRVARVTRGAKQAADRIAGRAHRAAVDTVFDHENQSVSRGIKVSYETAVKVRNARNRTGVFASLEGCGLLGGIGVHIGHVSDDTRNVSAARADRSDVAFVLRVMYKLIRTNRPKTNDTAHAIAGARARGIGSNGALIQYFYFAACRFGTDGGG